jgi:hypothetical protein
MALLSAPERRDFREIFEDRYQVGSTILSPQLSVSRWHEQIGDPTLAPHSRPPSAQRPRFGVEESGQAEHVKASKHNPSGSVNAGQQIAAYPFNFRCTLKSETIKHGSNCQFPLRIGRP